MKIERTVPGGFLMNIELYHRQNCPYSVKVRNFLTQAHLQSEVKYHDVDQDPASEEELFELTHDEQVPCLVVDGNPLLESEAIIRWLNSHREEIQRDSSPSFSTQTNAHRESTRLVNPEAD